jgi:hypothetical protein
MLLKLTGMSFCVVALLLLVVGAYYHVDMERLGLDTAAAALGFSGGGHEEALVVVTSWLPASISACVHDVFARHAPLRKPTPAEYRVAGIDHIYVIHWTPLKERVTTMASRFDRILAPGWADHNYVTFVNPFDAHAISESDALCLAGPEHAKLREGTLSVTTKHHLAYYDVLVNNHTVVLVLEDDTDFIEQFVDQMSKIMSALSTVPGWSNCMVSGGDRGEGSVAASEPYINGSPEGVGSQFAYGYLVSRVGAAQLLSNMPIRDNPDWQMNYAAREVSGFRSYMSTANPIFEAADAQDGSWKTAR